MSASPSRRTPTRRKRRGTAAPIEKYTSRAGVTTYSIRVTTGKNADGTIRRERHTFPTREEAETAFKVMSAGVALGTHTPRTTVTLGEYVETWLAGRTGVRPGTVLGYRHQLQPVVDALGDKAIQSVSKSDIDALVKDRMGLGGRRGRVGLTDGAQEVLDAVAATGDDGIRYSEIEARFGGPGARRLDRLREAGLVERIGRGRYASTGISPTSTGRGGVSATTVGHMLTTLTSVMEAACSEGLLVRNPARLVDRPRRTAYELTVWSPSTRQAFAEHVAGDRLAGCWHLSLVGLRRSEVMGMTWDALDLDGGLAHVRQARTPLGPTGDRIDAPKSARSRRVVPLDAVAVAALRRMRTVQTEERLAAGSAWTDEGGLIAVDETGRRLRPERYTDRFRDLVEEAGLPVVRLHDLRGSVNSAMAEQGVPPEVRAAVLGHDPKMNLSHYTVVSADAMVAALRTVSGG